MLGQVEICSHHCFKEITSGSTISMLEQITPLHVQVILLVQGHHVIQVKLQVVLLLREYHMVPGYLEHPPIHYNCNLYC